MFRITRKYFSRKGFIILMPLSLAALAILADIILVYLADSDMPSKDNTEILFSGRDYHSRMKEVRALISEGYVDRLMIPVYDQLTCKKERAGENGRDQLRMPSPVLDLDNMEYDLIAIRSRNP